MIVSASLIASIYFLYNKVTGGIKLVERYNKSLKTSVAMRGVIVYAKDLLENRACIDKSSYTGLPETPCSLTSNQSLERLLLSDSVVSALCTFYENNGKPKDGSQNFCEPKTPNLRLNDFEFDIKKS